MLLPPNHYKLYHSYRLPELYQINECYECYVMNVSNNKKQTKINSNEISPAANISDVPSVKTERRLI